MHSDFRIIGRDEVARHGDYLDLGEAIAQALRAGVVCPLRAHHRVSVPGARAATLLTMPAWQEGGYLGVKIASVFPDNAASGMETVRSQYLLMSAVDGSILALVDGGELTARRTAAASALASHYLSRADARIFTFIGTGRLALHLVREHLKRRSGIETIWIWGRSKLRSAAVADALANEGYPAEACDDLEQAVRSSDLISVATLSAEPLVRGDWLAPGAHLDLVGGFTAQMREADDAAVIRAAVFCDSPAALTESGDLAEPIARQLVDPANIADLASLCRGERAGRDSADQITLFKSVGFAAEDLASAVHVYEATTGASKGS